MLNKGPKFEAMKQIRDEIMDLKESPLYKERIENGFFPVIGSGSHDSKIMFVGEAPGKNEAKTGKPFCGASGKILDELLAHIKLKRDDVYITNLVKDRPTANRDPLPNEIEIYSKFLDKQIEIIQPKVIVTLGRFSMSYLMKKFGLEEKLDIISKIHGKVFETNVSYGKIKIIPLYHPAVAIYSRTQLPQLKKDFEVLKQYNS